jgi:aspartyl-tRNA(Asn)/glutamyl-tRNA(Gln) amidotransferase subunit C
MKLTKETVERLAELSKLEFNDVEKTELVNDLNRIIGFIEKLNELDTDGVEPLIYLSEEKNVLRPDEVQQEISHEEILQNAPKKDSDYFRVPKVLDR